MAIRKFLTSVADVYGYDSQTDDLLFVGKTLVDSSIEVSLGSNPVRGGRGNQLQYVYYHTGEMNFTLTDTQWNLGLLGATVGSEIGHDENIYHQENVTLATGGIATVTEATPLAFTGSTIYGWSTDSDGRTTKFEFTGSTSTGSLGAKDEVVCIRYYTASQPLGESNSFTIKANMIPKVVKLVMEAQLNSADVSTNKIGIVQIIAPRVTLSGAFSISMTSDGVANTPLTGMALAYIDPASASGACSSEPYYAKVIEIIDNSNWYDNVTLTIADQLDNAYAFTANVAVANYTPEVWAVPGTGAPYLLAANALDFTWGTPANHANITANLTTGTITCLANSAANAVGGKFIIALHDSASVATYLDLSITV